MYRSRYLGVNSVAMDKVAIANSPSWTLEDHGHNGGPLGQIVTLDFNVV